MTDTALNDLDRHLAVARGYLSALLDRDLPPEQTIDLVAAWAAISSGVDDVVDPATPHLDPAVLLDRADSALHRAALAAPGTAALDVAPAWRLVAALRRTWRP
jgi:hypothetical protein